MMLLMLMTYRHQHVYRADHVGAGDVDDDDDV